MKLCVVSYKGCWQDASGTWYSSGGFPLQIQAIASLFESLVLLTVVVAPKAGGIPLPPGTQVIPVARPRGQGLPRKLSALAHFPRYVVQIARSAGQADVLHIPLPGDISLIGMLVGLAMRKRQIVRYGSSWEINSQTTWMNRVTIDLMRRFAGGRNVMLATGLGNQPPAANVHWLFVTAISRAEMQSVRPDLDRGRHHPLRLAYVGRLSPEKGVADLLQSLIQLKQQGFGGAECFHLDLIGDGPERARLEQLALAGGIAAEVTFCGQNTRAELVGRLLETDVCVLPSLTESFCKARLDAFLCGTPVLTSEVGFGREIVGPDGERGWVSPSGDVRALAAALRQIESQPQDWSGLRQRCRQYVEGYTLDAWAREIGQICAAQWGLSLEDGKLSA